MFISSRRRHIIRVEKHRSPAPVERLFQKDPHYLAVEPFQLRQEVCEALIAMEGGLIHQRRYTTLTDQRAYVLKLGRFFQERSFVGFGV